MKKYSRELLELDLGRTPNVVIDSPEPLIDV